MELRYKQFFYLRAWSVCMYNVHTFMLVCVCMRVCACMSVYVHCTCMHVCVFGCACVCLSALMRWSHRYNINLYV